MKAERDEIHHLGLRGENQEEEVLLRKWEWPMGLILEKVVDGLTTF